MTDQTYLDEDGVARLSRLVSYFEDAESATSTARELSERDRRYYDNFDDSQWTAEEKKVLAKRRQPITTSNRIKPKINFMLGEEAKRRSMPKAHPRTPKDQEGAGAATDGLRYIIDDNQYQNIRSGVFKNLCIEGLGGIEIRAEQLPMTAPTAAPDYKIILTQLEWDRIFYDPHSRKPDFSDAKYVGQVIWMDDEDARADYPGAEEVFAATWASEAGMSDTYGDTPRARWTDSKRKRIRIAEVWHKEGGVWYHCVYTKGGVISEQESPYKDSQGQSLRGLYLQSCFVDADGNRYGVARDWISIQDEINKRRSKALHLLSVRQTKGPKGAVEDVNRMKAELAKPDGHVETTPGMEVEIIQNGDLSQGNMALLQEAKSEIDSLGVNAQMAGSDARNMSGRALMKREESGMSEIGPVYDMLNQFDHAVYRACWSMVKQFWTAEKWIRITDDEEVPRFVGLNQPITLGQQLIEEARAQGQQITPEMEQQAQMDPRMRQQVGVKNNVAEMDVDIVIDSGPASATIQAEQYEQIADLAKVRGDIPTPLLIEMSNIRGKEKIIKKMTGGEDIPPQVKQQMTQMQQQLQQGGQAYEQLKQQLQAAQSEQQMRMQELQNQARELEIKWYEAETKRLALNANSQPAPQMPMQPMEPPPMSDAEKMDRDAALKIRLKEMDKEREIILKQLDMQHADEQAHMQMAADAMAGMGAQVVEVRQGL